MSVSRLTLALDQGAVQLPAEGAIGVFGAPSGYDLSGFPKDRTCVFQGFKPDHDAFALVGWTVLPKPEGRFALSIVIVPRAKDEARALIAEAVRATEGPVVIDGQKTDGVESLLKALKRVGSVGGLINKAHGKLFTVEGADVSDWPTLEPGTNGGYVTAPGVFSANGPDKGSVLLANALPNTLKGRVADLGAGWGYLSSRILEREAVQSLECVEASHAALDCARLNVSDPRATFHWADATRFEADPFDVIVTNPPFHTSRAGDPGIGQSFIAAARRLLKPSGQLWLVANRHLPYEKTLSEAFLEVNEIGQDPGFKLFHATRPRRERK